MAISNEMSFSRVTTFIKQMFEAPTMYLGSIQSHWFLEFD